MAKNQVNARQHPAAQLLLFENYSHSPSMLSSKNNRTKKNFTTPYYGWDSTASGLEPLRGGSLRFTTIFPEIPGTHFINLGRMEPPSGFEHGTSGLRIQRRNH